MKKFDRKGIRQCVDRYINEADELLRAASVAIEENPANAPLETPGVELHPVQLALLTNVKWGAGRKLLIAFLDGKSSQQDEVKRQAEMWLPHVNLSYDWNASTPFADIRISFRGVGAWSYLGTDCLSIGRAEPTMNFGFLQPGTAAHEFGHALGCIHEHQSPGAGGIPWNESAVYAYYSGPPNNWTRPMIAQNILEHYAKERTQYTSWDKGSIMEYPIDAALLKDPSFAVGWNTQLSETDKQFIATLYPRTTPPPPPPPPKGKRTVVITFDDGAGRIEVDGKAA